MNRKLQLPSILLFVPIVAHAQLISITPDRLPQRSPSKHEIKMYGTSVHSLPIEPTIVALGQGYNALTGDVLSEVCVDKVRDDKTFGKDQIGGGFNHEYINVVSNMAEHHSASGTSAGFDFTYKLFSVGFETGSSSGSYYNSVDQFARIYKRVMTAGEARIGGDWSPVARQFIKRPLQEFTQKCGTHYIRGIYAGHVIDETVRFTLQQSKYSSENRNSFSVGVKSLFGFNYGDQDTESKVNAMSGLSIQNDSRGLINSLPIPQPSDATADSGGVRKLVKFVREEWPTKIAASNPNQAEILLIEITPYYQLAASGSGQIPEWPNDILQTIQDREALYERFLSAKSDLAFAAQLPSGAQQLVYDESTEELQKKLTLAEDFQTDLRKSAKECNDLLKQGVEEKKARMLCESKFTAKLTPQVVSSITPKLKPIK